MAKRYDYIGLSREIRDDLEDSLRKEISTIDLEGIIKEALAHFHIDLENIDIEDKNFRLAIERGLYYALNAVKRDIKVDMGEIDLADLVTLNKKDLNYKIYEAYRDMKRAMEEGNKELAKSFRDDFFAAMTIAQKKNIVNQNYVEEWMEAYNDALNDFDQVAQTRFQKLQIEIQSQLDEFERTQIMAENIVKKTRESLGSGATDDEVQGVLGKILPKITDDTKKAADAQEELQDSFDDTSHSATITAKSLEELVELYHQLGTSGGSQKSLEEVSNAILDIIQAERQLDPEAMKQYTDVLRNLVTGGEGGEGGAYTVEETVNALKKLQEVEEELEAQRRQNMAQADEMGHLEEMLGIERDTADHIERANDYLREELYLREQERNTLSNNLEEEKAKTAELEKQNKLLEEQRDKAERDAQSSDWVASEYASQAWEYENQLTSANGKIEELEDKLKEAQAASEQIVSDGLFDSANTSQLVGALVKISDLLTDIRNTLGTIDDTSGLKSLVNTFGELLDKLETIQSKVGTGVYNIQVHQGANKEALSATQSTEAYLRTTEAKYMKVFQQIMKKGGGEGSVFAAINEASEFAGGISELQRTFSSLSITQIASAEERVNRLMKFFEVLQKAMKAETFELIPYIDQATQKVMHRQERHSAWGLDLSGIRIPTETTAKNFRSTLKSKGLAGKKQEDTGLPDLKDDSQMLAEIVDKLGEIRDILNTISQDNSLKEMFTGAVERMDTLLNSFKELSVIATNNAEMDALQEQLELEQKKTHELEEQNLLLKEQQSALSLSSESTTLEELRQKLDEITQMIRTKTETFESEGVVVDSTVQRELTALDELRAKILDVTQAIFDKTSAFVGEGNVVDRTVQNELMMLEELRAKLGAVDSQTSITVPPEEVESFNNLRDVINGVRDAITNKNDALKEEIAIATAEIPKEIHMFEQLSGILTYISQRMAAIATNLQKLSKSPITKEALTESRDQRRAEEQRRREEERENARREREAERLLEQQQREEQAAIDRQSREMIQYYRNLEKKEVRYQELVAKRSNGFTLSASEESQLRTLQEERDTEYDRLNALQECTDEIRRAAEAYEQIKANAKQTAAYSIRTKLTNDITAGIDALEKKLNSGKFTTSSMNYVRQGIKNIKDNDYFNEDNLDRLKDYNALLKNFDRNLVKVGNNTKLTKLLGDVNAAMADNSKMSRDLMNNFRGLEEQIQKAVDVGASADEVQALTTRFLQLKNEMIKTGQTGHKFLTLVKNDITQASARMIAQYMSFQDWIRYIRNAMQAVTELNSALNQLKIVSGETDTALSHVAADAYNLANDLGMSTTEVVSSITEWRRLGKTVEESMILAEQAARLSTGGIMDISSATTALVSSMQAFEMGADEASKIVDQYIYLGKQLPIDNYIG